MGINNAITCLRASLRDLGAEGFSLLSAGESSLSEEEMGLQLCWVSRRNAGLGTDLQSLSCGLMPCPASMKGRKNVSSSHQDSLWPGGPVGRALYPSRPCRGEHWWPSLLFILARAGGGGSGQF